MIHSELVGGWHSQYDKDLWKYCIRRLVDEFDRDGFAVSPVVRFTANEFLRATARQNCHDDFEVLADALARLASAVVAYSASEPESYIYGQSHIVSHYTLCEAGPHDPQIEAFVTLPDWILSRLGHLERSPPDDPIALPGSLTEAHSLEPSQG